MTIEEKIRQRRRQMLVHSYLYYEMDTNIVSDATWAKWALELADLQKKYPAESRSVEDYDMFSDWDGSSGAHLIYGPDIISVANHLLQLHQNPKNDEIKPKVTKLKSSSKKAVASRKLF